MFAKELEENLSTDDLDEVFQVFPEIDQFINNVDGRLLDSKNVGSLERIRRFLSRFNTQERGGERGSAALEIIAKIDDVISYTADEIQTPSQHCPARKGLVKRIFYDKGFAFITDETSGEEWFFHRNDMHNKNSFIHLVPGTKVKFEFGVNDQGRCAVNVSLRFDN